MKGGAVHVYGAVQSKSVQCGEVWCGAVSVRCAMVHWGCIMGTCRAIWYSIVRGVKTIKIQFRVAGHLVDIIVCGRTCSGM